MRARFKSKCEECEDDIKIGKEIVRYKNRWIHEDCMPEEEEEET